MDDLAIFSLPRPTATSSSVIYPVRQLHAIKDIAKSTMLKYRHQFPMKPLIPFETLPGSH